MNRRSLYMIPSTLGDTSIETVIPAYNILIINKLSHFVVEDIRTARRFLKQCGIQKPIDELIFYELNEHTHDSVIPEILNNSGNSNLGLISDAGVPAIADPGAKLVSEAYRNNMRVIPLAGPSSIVLAMMASGLNGQNFAFIGYLPVKTPDRNQKIRSIEKRSQTEKQSQVFIEAPYRNNQLINALLEQCKPETLLCIAANLTLPDEWIMTKSVQMWKHSPPPDLKNQPAVFIVQA
jgi:16S rRNA (cytidine1402-2'-O)-methyltransferase